MFEFPRTVEGIIRFILISSILRAGHGPCHLLSGGAANVVLRYHCLMMNDDFTPEFLPEYSVSNVLPELPRSELVNGSTLFESNVQWALVRLMQSLFSTNTTHSHLHRFLNNNLITSIASGDFPGLGALTGL